jgi:hypothetical protein
MNLLYLMHLVQMKNDLNRKRRRFYHIWRGTQSYVRLHQEDKRYRKEKDYGYGQHMCIESHHPAFSKMEGKRGYEKAKKDMKAMTKHMREVRLAVGATYCWDDRGAIRHVLHEGKYYSETEIALLALKYRAENILMGVDDGAL